MVCSEKIFALLSVRYAVYFNSIPLLLSPTPFNYNWLLCLRYPWPYWRACDAGTLDFDLT